VVLHEGLLDALKAQWIRLGAPIVDGLRPGLSAEQLDDVAARLDLELPQELRILWTWHDGAAPHPVHRAIGPGGFEFLTSDEVVAARDLNLQIHPAEDAPFPGMFWRRTWIPFMNQAAQRLYVDAARETCSQASPVRLVCWDWEDFDVDVASSLGAAVSMWTWLLESDYYCRMESGGIEPVDVDKIPLFARWTLA
jgi:cell wall assembly regulator SMI1